MSTDSKEKEVKQKPKTSKTAMVVALRNKFFYVFYKHSTVVFLTSLLSLIVNVIFFFSFAKQPVPPQYIPTNEDGTLIKLIPVGDCNSKTEAEVKRFANNAIKKIYKYDYINYSEQLQDASAFFTGRGWDDYVDGFSKSDVLLAVKENQWVVTVKPDAVPEFTKQPYVDEGVCTWDIKAPISIMYLGKNAVTNKGDLYLRIVRVSVLTNSEGLGIKRSVFAPKS